MINSKKHVNYVQNKFNNLLTLAPVVFFSHKLSQLESLMIRGIIQTASPRSEDKSMLAYLKERDLLSVDATAFLHYLLSLCFIFATLLNVYVITICLFIGKVSSFRLLKDGEYSDRQNTSEKNCFKEHDLQCYVISFLKVHNSKILKHLWKTD